MRPFTLKKSDAAQDSLEHINADLARLIEHIRCSAAPEDVLSACGDHIRAASDLLQPCLHPGSYSAAYRDQQQDGFILVADDLTQCMPYSPVTGRKNPLSPAIKMWVDDKEVLGQAYFSASYAGPPDTVHGGIVAAVFDELLSMANILNGVAGFTGSLTIKYHHPTPINQLIELHARCIRVDGRKVISQGEMRANGQVTARAEGLFIKPRAASRKPSE
jgi:hypothetical protein